MKHLTFFLLFLIVMPSGHAQVTNSIFTVARSGTQQQMRDQLRLEKISVDTTDTNGFTPLILACYHSNQPVVEVLIKAGANLDYLSSMGTALMAASVKGDVGIADVLLKNGANVDLSDARGNTALIYAVKMQNTELVKLLLLYRPNKSLLDSDGKSAFEYAAFSGNQTIVELLKMKK